MPFGREPLSLHFRRLHADLVINQKTFSRSLAGKKRELSSLARAAVIREVCKFLGDELERPTSNETLASVSHDLRNPLASILCMLHVLEAERTRSGHVEGPLLDESLRTIRGSAERMRHLTCAVLSAQSNETLRRIKRPECVERLLNDAATLMGPLAKRRGITLDIEIDPNCREERAYCDREEVLRVFSNLLGNAIAYSPDGAKVHMSVHRANQEMIFAISDSGPGIPKAHHARIFERGWRGKRARSKTGLGLGLSIARGIVRSHSGRIWVKSAVGKGSTFYFTLPTAKEDVAKLDRIA